MQRFGRTAQTKMKDGWGGSFILAAILALALAYWAGNAISQKFGGTDAAGLPPSSVAGGNPTSGSASVVTTEPRQFQLYFVQAGAFRSDSKAKDLVRTLSDLRYPAMLTPRDSTGVSHVYAGVYTSLENANNAKSRLATDGITMDAFTKPVTIEHNPDAIPTISASTKTADLKNGLDALNTYLFEAAVFMEGRAAGGTSNTAGIAGLRQKLSTLATGMAVEKDPTAKQFAEVASAAAVNAQALESAASEPVASDAYQAAMGDFLSLLEQYRSLQPVQ